jgi:hypothetical protein
MDSGMMTWNNSSKRPRLEVPAAYTLDTQYRLNKGVHHHETR